MDIVDKAYAEGRLHHWDDLATWLKTHARNVNGIDDIIEASEAALSDGRIFPHSPEEAKLVIKKYRHTDRTLH